MKNRSKESLDDANEIVSELAYWITSCDANAALRIMEGFGTALATCASMRSGGSDAAAVVLALAERADALSRSEDAQHAGWLLLSLKIELLHLASSLPALPGRDLAFGLLQEVDEIIRELMRKGFSALAQC